MKTKREMHIRQLSACHEHWHILFRNLKLHLQTKAKDSQKSIRLYVFRNYIFLSDRQTDRQAENTSLSAELTITSLVVFVPRRTHRQNATLLLSQSIRAGPIWTHWVQYTASGKELLLAHCIQCKCTI